MAQDLFIVVGAAALCIIVSAIQAATGIGVTYTKTRKRRR